MTTKKLSEQQKESEVNLRHIRIKSEPEMIYLSDLEITTKGIIINKNDSEHLNDDYQISFTSNAMFMTILHTNILYCSCVR